MTNDSKLEKVVVRIHKATKDISENDSLESSSEVSHERVMAKLNEHFQLPLVYLEFLVKFSMRPLQLASSQLFTAQELLRQNKSWLPNFAHPETIVVIGTYGMCGDPLYLRLDLITKEDAPVYTLTHDSWDEESETNEVAKSFLAFLEDEAEVWESISSNLK